MNTDTLIEETGLKFAPAFVRDRQFHAALLAAPLALAVLALLYPQWPWPVHAGAPFILAAVLWQPVIEELLFRGVVQGKLSATRWGGRQVAGLSAANGTATLLFVLAHLLHHPPWQAVAVAVPSLVFGYFRDRHRQIYPSICLHAAYNAFYFLVPSVLAGMQPS